VTPYYADDWLTVYLGDCREVMAAMELESVHCVVTSPPYWGLRDYGSPGQLGLEPTPEAYVESMVAVFREVRRVLRKDGTVWLNLGDSYATGGGSVGRAPGGGDQGERFIRAGMIGTQPNRMPIPGLKPKDLVGIPWRVAFALQADGWYLRSDIIWSKPNPMPESVTDRPTKSHEYLFLLSKSTRYYYDQDAVREPATRFEGFYGSEGRFNSSNNGQRNDGGRSQEESGLAGRNLRSVWTIATQPYPGAHFATFPRALVEPCIKAGTSEKGVCPKCGAPWVREVEREMVPGRVSGKGNRAALGDVSPSSVFVTGLEPRTTTTGWRPDCRCEHDGGGWVPVPATVLDPFAGSGTTGLVAQSLSRRAVLIDLNGNYLTQVMERNRDIPLGLGA
jgi:DNA modification methylase